MELFGIDRVISCMRNLFLSWVAFSLTMTLDSIHTTLGKPIPAAPWLVDNFVRLQLESASEPLTEAESAQNDESKRLKSDGFQLIPNVPLPIEEDYRFRNFDN